MSAYYKKLLFPAPALNGEEETGPEDYIFEAKLGNGAFGQVWRIRQKKSSKVYACKMVTKVTIAGMIDQFRREVLIMYKLSHPHIVKLFHHFEDQENLYLVMEIAEGGNLFQRLAKEKTFIERLCFKFFKEILLAVEYLHLQQPAIIHRDIKPENILLSAQGKAKLTDFGWSNYYSADKSMPRYTVCGTYEYLCPEMVKESGHTPAVDIWCMGILLYEMYCGHTPFKAQTKDMLMENISKSKILFPNAMSPALKNLITRILEKNPEKRISIQAIKSHEWFSKFNSISPLKKGSDPRDTPRKEESKGKKGSSSKEVQLKLVRKSIAGIQSEVSQKQEQNKLIKNRVKELTEEIKNEEVTLKIVDREVLEKRKEVLEFEEVIRNLEERICDLDQAMEKIVIQCEIEEMQKRVEEKQRDLEVMTFEIADNETILFEMREKLQEYENLYIEKSRYIHNLTIFLKKLKEKGSALHKNSESQISELQISHECLKTRLAETEKILENLETPENKFARKLMRFVKEKKDTFRDFQNVEEKLQTLEESLCLKEVDLEKLKIDYLDRKKGIVKESWAEREKASRRRSAKEEFFENIRNSIGVKEALKEHIDKNRELGMKFKLESLDIENAKQKLNMLKQDIKTTQEKAVQSKALRQKEKLIVLKNKKNIESIELQLGIIKCKTLSLAHSDF